jgi:hypothetical protein
MRICSEQGDTMRRKLQKIPGRFLAIAGLAVLAFAAGSLLTSNLSAQPPNSPPPPLKVLEQNLDANGFIKVHEQGTANVSGTVAVSGGSITVSNFPSMLNLHPAAVIGALTFEFDIADGADVVEAFPTINTTAIHISAIDDEIQVIFQSALSNIIVAGTPNALFRFAGLDGELESFTQTLTQPVPLNGVRIFCQNEELNCGVMVSLIGTSQ